MTRSFAEFWNGTGWKIAYAAIVVVWLISMAVIFS